MIRKKHPDLPLPPSFDIRHVQSVPKYRKRSNGAACVDGPDVALSSLAITKPLGGALSAA